MFISFFHRRVPPSLRNRALQKGGKRERKSLAETKEEGKGRGDAQRSGKRRGEGAIPAPPPVYGALNHNDRQ